MNVILWNSDIGTYQLSIDGVCIHVHDSIEEMLEPIYRYEYPVWLLQCRGDWKHFACHRLMAETFLSKPDGHLVVHHKDHNKLNWALSNLEWCTQSRNIYLESLQGRLHNVLQSEVVHAICSDIVRGFTNRQIAQKYNITSMSVWNIRTGKRHIHISSQYAFPK